jgi:hypothetical protein
MFAASCPLAVVLATARGRAPALPLLPASESVATAALLVARLLASSEQRAREKSPRRSLFCASACDKKEDPGIEEAGKQGGDVSARQPVEPTKIAGDH